MLPLFLHIVETMPVASSVASLTSSHHRSLMSWAC
uniref:Uncharacterized protein n=1 Tax=Anguilla anguilla TaxID=7936 RepID=A0A0E9RU57_ANGAN